MEAGGELKDEALDGHVDAGPLGALDIVVGVVQVHVFELQLRQVEVERGAILII